MTAEMWRTTLSRVRRAGKYGFVQGSPDMHHAYPNQQLNYFFDDNPQAVTPLALVGTVDEILEFLMVRSHMGIESRIPELPDVYMKVMPFRRNVSRGLFPYLNAIHQLVDNFLRLVPGSDLTDLAGGAKDLVDTGKDYKKGYMAKVYDRPRGRSASVRPDMYSVFWSYLGEEGFTKIGTGRIGFDALWSFVEKELIRVRGYN